MTSQTIDSVLKRAERAQVLIELGELLFSARQTLEGAALETTPRGGRRDPSGSMTALREPIGGVRGIVVGDTFKRAVSRFAANKLLHPWSG